MEKKPVYLIFVDADNNGVDSNKYYKMSPKGDTFLAEYGRVGSSPQTKIYPMSKWDSTLKSKLKKGYQDRTDLMTDVIEDSKVDAPDEDAQFAAVQKTSIRDILKRLWDFANKAIQSSYTIKAEVVTQAMVDAAQKQIDYMADAIKDSSMTVEEFNQELNKLFVIIPRKMARVSDHLVHDTSEFEKKLASEQSILDTMAGQVYKPQKKDVETKTEDDKPVISILDTMGIEMEDATDEDVAKIKKAMGDSANKFYRAWRVSNKETEEVYKKFTAENNIGNVKLLCHGSRNQNWFNILKMGLKIRPAGAIVTGSMFGSQALYFSNPDKYHGGVAKSIGYTSLGGYWTRDYQNCGFLAFYDVALGESYDVYSFDSKYYTMDIKKLHQINPNAWHLWAHGNTNMLRNDEIVVYTTEQMTVRYLVEIR